MDDKAFKDFVVTHAQRFETETLEELATFLHEIVNLRKSGRPPGLKIGVSIEAIHLTYNLHDYGEVVRTTSKACFIKSPGSEYETRIAFSKHAIRLIEGSEWYWIEKQILENRAKYRAEAEAEDLERQANNDEILRQRDAASREPRTITLGSGNTVPIYLGEFIHAYREDSGYHAYGMVIQLNPKGCYIAPPHRNYDDRVIFSKYVTLDELSAEDWGKVSAAFEASDAADGVEVAL